MPATIWEEMDVTRRFIAEFAAAAKAHGLAGGAVVAPFALPPDMLPAGYALWRPGAVRPVAFLGDPAGLPVRRLARWLFAGATSLICLRNGAWIRIGLAALLKETAKRFALERLKRRPDNDLLVAFLRARRRDKQPTQPVSAATPNAAEDIWRDLIACAAAQPLHPDRDGPIIHANVGLGPGGAERQIVDTLLALKRDGLAVAFVGEALDLPEQAFHMATLRRAGIACAGPVSPASEWLELPSDLGAALARIPFDAAGRIVALARIFAARKARVVHGWQDESGARAVAAALIAGVPVVALSGVSLAPEWIPGLAPWAVPAWHALARSPRIRLANNSRAGAASYASHLGIAADRIAVVPNGVDLDRLAQETRDAHRLRGELGAAPDAFLVVGVLRLAPEKRPLLWIDAAASAARTAPHLRFALIGTGPLEPVCRAAIARAGLGDRLRLIAPRADAAACIAAADLMLLTSAVEGLPNVILEALAVGTPVVATAAGDIALLLAEGRGLCLPGDVDADAAAVGDAIVRAASASRPDPAAGIAFVRENHALDAMMVATRKLYWGA